MFMIIMYWNGRSLLKFDNSHVLEIRKKILYMLLNWDKLKIDFSLIGYNEGKAVCNPA